MAINTHFDANKGVEVILYIASKAQISDIYHVCKIMYFADKEHLAQFGRQICGDNYRAMKNGPVNCGIYDIIKDVRKSRTPYTPQDALEKAKASFSIKNDVVNTYREPNHLELSRSDKMVLDKVIAEMGDKSFAYLNKASHDEAWNSAYSKRPNSLMSIEEIVRVACPQASKELIEHLRG